MLYELRRAEQREAKRYGTTEDDGIEGGEGNTGEAPEWLARLGPAELALRKLIDAIGESAPHWESATSDSQGIPYTVSEEPLWLKFRQLNFSRKRSRMLGTFFALRRN